MLPIEGVDARAEECADVAPATGHGPAGERQPDARVEPPEGIRGAARDAELERGEPAAGAQHAGELGERRRRIVDVAEQIGEGDVIEGGVTEGEPLSAGPYKAGEHAIA